MNIIYNLIINTYSILILLIIAFQHKRSREKNNLQYHLFFAIVLVNIILLFVDIMGRLDGNLYSFFPLFNHVGNFLLFLMNPLLPSLWFMYAHHQIFRNEKETMKLVFPLVLLNAINFIILIMSQTKGYYYYIDSDNIYHRGSVFVTSTFVIITILIITFVMIFIKRRSLTKSHFYSLLFFPVIPILAIFLQLAFYGFSFQLSCTVLSILIIFLNIQNDQINTDYVTGLNNRKKLEEYFRKKVSGYTSDSRLSAIIVSIDDFKALSDRQGVKESDLMLQNVAKILSSSLLGKFFISRFTGGEFCIILDESDNKKLNNIINLIDDNVKLYNRNKGAGKEIKLVMGYAVYNDSYITIDNFWDSLDESKKAKR